ncbi:MULTISPECIES: DUF6895 family protein [Streptomyces]|uniref:DUF6895 family protein n=1 Tax=Streptomyces TaxID=1883 RepID=UPI00163D3CFE|nr:MULTISPECIES: hypothetical protein [Streptomyces]MBC2874208.1 hypothetical protein [Streptomyces sp. TYQ1024]UBI40250.1 hypothetical protein K7I03_29890 [Streptomyces mobaraensis]UKW32828.1 hypothetical protein MCU78_29815 [Streptomyces sp. TYQ1024]
MSTTMRRVESAGLLVDMADGAMTWLRENHAYCALPADVSPHLAHHMSEYKALAEMALAAQVTSEALPTPRNRDRARDILDHCWRQLGQGDLLYERQLRHLSLPDPVEIYAHFVQAGYRHSGLEQLLRRVHRLTAFQAAELYPNRRLAVANAQRLAGLPHPHPGEWGEPAARTWLGSTPEPWAIDWNDAYCLTHTVYHLADWGRRPLALPPHVIGYLTRWLPVWLDVWCEAQEWDLVAELLFVDVCVPEPELPAAQWEALAAAQEVSGRVPPRGKRPGTGITPGPTSDPSGTGPAAPDATASGLEGSGPAAPDATASGPAAPDPAASGPVGSDPAASGPVGSDPTADFRRHQHTTCVTAMAAARAAHAAHAARATRADAPA